MRGAATVRQNVLTLFANFGPKYITCTHVNRGAENGGVVYNIFFFVFCVKDKTEKTVEIAIHLSPKQLDRAVPVLEEIIQEMVEDHDKGTRLRLALQTELTVKKHVIM